MTPWDQTDCYSIFLHNLVAHVDFISAMIQIDSTQCVLIRKKSIVGLKSNFSVSVHGFSQDGIPQLSGFDSKYGTFKENPDMSTITRAGTLYGVWHIPTFTYFDKSLYVILISVLTVLIVEISTKKMTRIVFV